LQTFSGSSISRTITNTDAQEPANTASDPPAATAADDDEKKASAEAALEAKKKVGS